MNSDKEKEIEIEHLQFAYNKALEIFKLNNDNYFKRVQIIMVALQAGLFITFLKLLQLNSNLFMTLILQIVVIFIGGGVAYIWAKLMGKQLHYLELQKRYLRNIERRFVELAVAVDYFNIEGAIMSNAPKEEFKTLTAKIKSEKDNELNKFAEFKWGEKRYPESSDSKDKIHRVDKVSGGLNRTEKLLAKGFLWVWPTLLILLIVCYTIPRLFSILKEILCN